MRCRLHKGRHLCVADNVLVVAMQEFKAAAAKAGKNYLLTMAAGAGPYGYSGGLLSIQTVRAVCLPADQALSVGAGYLEPAAHGVRAEAGRHALCTLCTSRSIASTVVPQAWTCPPWASPWTLSIL